MTLPTGPRTDADSRRVYAGLTAEERTARRREALVEGAARCIGRDGYPDTSIRAICREAGLSERYFYESFSGRREILVLVYDSIIAQARTHVLDAVGTLPQGTHVEELVRVAVGAFVAFAIDEPERINILLVDEFGMSTEKEVLEIATDSSFTTLIRSILDEATGGAEHRTFHYLAVGMVGVLTRILGTWKHEGRVDPPEVLVEAATIMALSSLRGALAVVRREAGPVGDPGELASRIEVETADLPYRSWTATPDLRRHPPAHRSPILDP